MARPRTISDDQILQTARECFLTTWSFRGRPMSSLISWEYLAQALFKRFSQQTGSVAGGNRSVGNSPASWIPMVEAGPDERSLDAQLTEILEELADFFVDICSPHVCTQMERQLIPKDLFARYDEAPPLVDIRVLSGWLRRAAARGMIRDVDFKSNCDVDSDVDARPSYANGHAGKTSHRTYTKRIRSRTWLNVLLQGLMPRHKNS